MEWIKKNYDRFLLILLAFVLVGSSGFLYWQGQQFLNSFGLVQQKVVHGSKVDPADSSALSRARESLAKAAEWKEKHQGSLFVSRAYIVVKDQAGVDQAIDPTESDICLHPPVPNKWLIDNRLDLLDVNVLNEDADGDGFSNLDEWNGKTNPQDKTSHPPYVTKLRLGRWIKVQFRLKFAAYDESSFQINTLDVRQPSQFVKLGEIIPGTKFKVIKFDKKTVSNPQTGAERDISELTVQHSETEEMVTLVLDTVVNSPDSYAEFRYLWNNTVLRVKKEGKFVLQPETDVEYKVVDISDNEAVIKNLKTSAEIKIPSV